MMKVKVGFLLPSLIIYIAIFTLLAAASVRLSTVIIPVAYRLMHWSSITDFYNAHDLLYKELRCGPAKSDFWYQVDRQGIIWSTGIDTKGFVIAHGNLIYKEGQYDPRTQTWTGTINSLLVKGFAFKVVNVERRNDQVEIACHAQSTAYPAHHWWCYVKLPSIP